MILCRHIITKMINLLTRKLRRTVTMTIINFWVNMYDWFLLSWRICQFFEIFDPSFQSTSFDFAKKGQFSYKVGIIIASNTIISKTPRHLFLSHNCKICIFQAPKPLTNYTDYKTLGKLNCQFGVKLTKFKYVRRREQTEKWRQPSNVNNLLSYLIWNLLF